MSDNDLDDFEDDNFEDDDDAKKVDEAETVAARLTSLEKRRLIDNMLEEKRLARELKDGFDEDFDDDLDDDLDGDLDGDFDDDLED